MSIETTTYDIATRDPIESTTDQAATGIDLARVEAFAMQVAVDQGAASNAVLAYLGDRLGIWRALATSGPVTSEQLARHTGLAERYLREWLAAQASAGYVLYDAQTRAFTFPAEHALVLADDDSPAAMAGSYETIAAVWATVDRLAHGYATGEGVAWHEHDSRLFSGVERFFRPLYRNSLLTEWLPQVPGLVERLEEGITVLDVGCGLGTATVLMAEAFPSSTFVGVDYHEESVRRATEAAAEAGVSDRLTFEVNTTTSYEQRYDLICFFDTVHDLGDPVGALAHARSKLAEGGRVVAVEPFASDELAEGTDPVALRWYTASHSICMPNALAQGGEALGAQAGPKRTLEVFDDAGFGHVRHLASTAYNIVIEARD